MNSLNNNNYKKNFGKLIKTELDKIQLIINIQASVFYTSFKLKIL